MSKISICNDALGAILIDPIESLSESTSKAAKYCNLYYDNAVKTLLRSFPFNFAIKKKKVAPVDDVDTYDWQYAYQYPSDCLNLLRVTNTPSVNAIGSSSHVFYNVSNYYYIPFDKDVKLLELFDIGLSSDNDKKLIYSNLEEPFLVYVKNVQDTSLFDPLFRELLVYFLAMKLASSLTGDKNLISNMTTMYMANLRNAKQINAQEGNTIVPIHNRYKKSRR